MPHDDLKDRLPRERLLSEAGLDRVKHVCVRGVLFVEYVLRR